MLALTAKTLFSPLEQIDEPLVLLENGIIIEVVSRASRELPAGCRRVDFRDAVLAPGFVDIHLHGAAGHDVMQGDAEALPAIERFLAQHGASSYFPTTVTAPIDKTLSALERLASAVELAQKENSFDDGTRARPLGIHLEGPFLSHRRRGVHPPEDLLQPSLKVFERLWQASRGHAKVMTIAPELEGAEEVIAEAARRGVCVSVGHSDADFKTTQAAVHAGARHATHTFNAMRPLNHRDPGILGEVLSDERVSADIIADGLHVDPAIVKLFLQAKGPDRSVLITDSTAATGMPDGTYSMGAFTFEVKDGKCLANGILAGSLLTMEQAVRNVMQFVQWDLQQVLPSATMNPARMLGLGGRKGMLVSGAEADIAVLKPSGEVIRTIVCGTGI